MTRRSITTVEVPGWPRPRGYANGMIADGPVLFVAGQIGWQPDGTFATDELVGQFDQALANVVAVVEAAGAGPEQIVSMTVYVTEIETYRTGLAAIGEIWRRRMGRHYPVMTLVAVPALVEPRAKVEIAAHASI